MKIRKKFFELSGLKSPPFFILSILLITLIISVSAEADTLIDEGFDYTDVFTNHGWIYIGGCDALDNKTPTNISIFSPTTNLGFGIDYVVDQSCNFGYNRNLRRNIGNYSQRTISIEYDFFHNETANQIGTYVSLVRLCPTYLDCGTTEIGIFHLPPSGNNYTSVKSTGLFGFTDCTIGQSHFGNHKYKLDVDFSAMVYNFYIDDVNYCANVSAGAISGELWSGIYLTQNIPSKANHPTKMWIDNILIINSSSGLSPIAGGDVYGYPCSSDDDCASGFCDGGYCGLAPAHYTCDADSDCLSGSCINNKCTNPDVIDSITYFISQYIGKGTSTFNFVALTIILGLTLIVGFYGRSWVLALITFYSISAMTLFIGWLSVFLFFIFMIAGIIGLFIMMYLKSKD